MKKLAYLIAAVVFFAACDCREIEDGNLNRETTKKIMAQETVGKNLNSDLEVSGEDIAIASVFDNGSYRDTEILHRSLIANDLGSRETTEVGEWTVISMTVGEPKKGRTRDGENPLFTVTEYTVTINSTITNGEVIFNPEYILEYETCSWSNGDTTIVFDIHWDILGELVKVNGKVVTDELSTSFCEYRQTANEIGNLTIPATTSRFISADFAVTTDPDHENTWLVGCAVKFTDGTWALALDVDGTPVEARSNFWPGEFYNGEDENGNSVDYNCAYYIPNKGKWIPAFAHNKRDCMEWTANEHGIDQMSYTTADRYTNWGNGSRCEYGSHSVNVTGYSVKDNPESQTLTFYFNGVAKGTLSYADLK